MSATYKVAIVGCGGISRAHGDAWKDLPEVELVAACDSKPEPLANFVQTYSVPNAFNDLRRMLETTAPDILVVATWPTLHLPHALEGLRAGVRGILCEKPFMVNASQAVQVIEVASSRNILLMEGFMYRHHPLTLAVKEQIDSGAIGEVRFVRATFSTGLTDRTNWRLRGDLGGGAAMDLGCYCIDCIRYMVGAEPYAVWATGRFEPINDVWETLIGTLDFGNGVTGQFDCGFGWVWRETYEIVGTTGTIHVPKAWSNSHGKCTFTIASAGKVETVAVEGVNPYRTEMENLCESLTLGTKPRLTIDDILGNMRVIDAIHESAHTGQRIELV